MTPKIDKRIPMPGPSKTNKRLPTLHNNGDNRRTKYPFARMRVGDSFFLPNAGRHAIHRAVHDFRNRKDVDYISRRFAVRQWMQDNTYGYRVWRTG